MMEMALYLGVGSAAALIVEGLYLTFGSDRREKRAIQKRLRQLAEQQALLAEARTRGVEIVKRRDLSDTPWIHRLLSLLPAADRMALQIERAGLEAKLDTIVGASLASGVLSAATTQLLSGRVLLTLILGASFGAAPWGYVWAKRLSRRARFSTQLPEAVDLLVRSLKAGHSLSSGFRLISQELTHPIAGEFGHVAEELKLGRDLEQALRGLRERIDSSDVRLFTTAILIQRETGGNLVEILENLAAVIRKRMAFTGKLAAMTAEGRLSGIILMSLPPAMALIIGVVQPDYIAMLLETPQLKLMLGVTVILQIAGMLWIKKIVSVRY